MTDRWMVTGTQPVMVNGVRRDPDTTFEADLDEDQRSFFVGIGAISPAGKTDIAVPSAPSQAEFMPESEDD